MTSLLGSAPPTYPTTRAALHAVAEWVLASARHAATGRIGLRSTPGGFGTGELPDGRELSVVGTDLVVVAERTTVTPLRTLGEAALAAGVPGGTHSGAYTPTTAWEPDSPLDLDPSAADCLATWFAFATSVLEVLRGDAASPSAIQLWPEHFDLAFDAGDEAAGRRVNFGASAGDGLHPLPYLYVGPWSTFDRTDPFWNEAFGASLLYTDLVAADDQRATALAFLREGRDHI
jgi:hypothetical protein